MNKFEVTQEDFFINILQSQKEMKAQASEHAETLTDHERRLVELETNVPIAPAFNNYLSRIRRSRIVKLLGGKESKAYRLKYPESYHYKTLASKAFAEAERRFKQDFNLRNYGELRQHQYEDAIKYWTEFELSDTVMREIYTANNQLELLSSIG